MKFITLDFEFLKLISQNLKLILKRLNISDYALNGGP